MVEKGNPDRRNSPTQYALSKEHMKIIDTINWKEDLSVLKSLPNFWATEKPMQFTNLNTHGHHNHLCFCGKMRWSWDKYGFLPASEEIGSMGEPWLHAREIEGGNIAIAIDIEVYHQWHKSN